MLRQLLVGTVVSVCNIAIHALVMATVVQMSSRIAGATDTVRQSLRMTTVAIAWGQAPPGLAGLAGWNCAEDVVAAAQGT